MRWYHNVRAVGVCEWHVFDDQIHANVCCRKLLSVADRGIVPKRICTVTAAHEPGATSGGRLTSDDKECNGTRLRFGQRIKSTNVRYEVYTL